MKELDYTNFDEFINQLEYNYPYNTTVFGYYYTMKNNVEYLKNEILLNLVALSKDDRKPYLNRIRYKIAYHKQFVWSSWGILGKWFEKYKVLEEDDCLFRMDNNPLHQILNSDRPKFVDTYKKDYNVDTVQIQDEFYNFYYGMYIDEAVAFIDEQINDLNIANNTTSSTTTNPGAKPKTSSQHHRSSTRVPL